MRIVISGGGIGGPAAAVSLERMGFDDLVLLEQAPQFCEIVGGIQVSNNGARLMGHLGLENAIWATAFADREAVSVRNASMRGRAVTDPHGESLRGYDVVAQTDVPLEEAVHLPAPDLAAFARTAHA